MRFIFTAPTFVKQNKELHREFYIDHHNEKTISGNEFEIKLRNEMKQSAIAKECSDWLREKVKIKSLKNENMAKLRLLKEENYTFYNYAH